MSQGVCEEDARRYMGLNGVNDEDNEKLAG